MNIEAESLSRLKTEAISAAGNSYSPYSKFKVGAAVIDRAGTVYSGCNVENASFGLTQCAERNAINTAIAAGSDAGSLLSLVIYTSGQYVSPPCGACRQVMQELMAEDSEVISCCDSDEIKVWTQDEYLPDPFEYQY
jgi:cytidine deaminase